MLQLKNGPTIWHALVNWKTVMRNTKEKKWERIFPANVEQAGVTIQVGVTVQADMTIKMGVTVQAGVTIQVGVTIVHIY